MYIPRVLEQRNINTISLAVNRNEGMKRKAASTAPSAPTSKGTKANSNTTTTANPAASEGKTSKKIKASSVSADVLPSNIVEVISCTAPNFGEQLCSLITTPDGYKEAFGAIISDSEHFFRDFWEKKACIIRRKCVLTEEEGGVFFSKKYLADVLDDNIIAYSTNITMCKYEDLKRVGKTFDGTFAASKEVLKAFKDGYTAQFYQPQRFSDGLYCINAGFEHLFGTLAGASAYLTPSSSQGLAPHYDDVEVFIFQTEGTKRWRLWLNNLPLPDTCSHDIPRDRLPPLYAEFVLRPGDILYMPRGTIHEADALDDFSTHVTISVYQKNHYRAFLDKALPSILDAAFESNIEFRRGLPLRFQDFLGTFPRSNPQTSDGPTTARGQFKSQVAGLLRSLADCITDESIDMAADEMVFDFVKNRLPPPDLPPTHTANVDEEEEEEEEGGNSHIEFIDISKLNAMGSPAVPKLTKTSVVQLIDPRSFFACLREGEDADEECLELYHSRNNNRLAHMNHPPPDFYVDKSSDGGLCDDDDEEEEEDASASEVEEEEEEEGGDESDGDEGKCTYSMLIIYFSYTTYFILIEYRFGCPRWPRV